MNRSSMRVLLRRFLLLAFATVLFYGCDKGPRDINFNKENCDNCSMTIADPRFAAQIVTEKGKTYVFDAVECAAAFVNDKRVEEKDIAGIWVMNYNEPGQFINAQKAWYLRHESIASPMGMNLASFKDEASFRELEKETGGILLRWLGLRLLIAKEWSD